MECNSLDGLSFPHTDRYLALSQSTDGVPRSIQSEALLRVAKRLEAFVQQWIEEKGAQSQGQNYDRELSFAADTFIESIQRFAYLEGRWQDPLPNLVHEDASYWHGRSIALWAGSYLLTEGTTFMTSYLLGKKSMSLVAEQQAREEILDFVLRLEQVAYEHSLSITSSRRQT